MSMLSHFMPMCFAKLFSDMKFLPTLFLPAVAFILQGLAHCHLLCEVFHDSLKQQQSLPLLCTHSPWLDLKLLTLDSNWFLGVYLLHSTLSSSRVETLLFFSVSTAGRTGVGTGLKKYLQNKQSALKLSPTARIT